MSKKNYIPRPDGEFSSWFDILVREVGLHTTGASPDWNHITAESKDELLMRHGEWSIAYGEAKDDPTNTKKREKNRVRKIVEKAVRVFVNQYLRYPPVTNAERDVMGIINKSEKRVSKKDPVDHVDFEFIVDPQSHTVWIKYRIAGSKKRGKGDYHGVEIRYWIRALNAPGPVDANEEGWHSVADTASPWKKTFDGIHAGMRLWVSIRWENASTGDDVRTGKGPWSVIKNIIIP
ncbi:MAG: hypothetical protein LBS82_04490 [Spirochaetaceae bacterium]|nr:hypothetical protein [Spirochaetaceae bacterium]